MRRTQLRNAVAVLLITGGVLVSSCRPRDDVSRARSLLVVVPGSTDVTFRGATVSYRLSDAYPAQAAIKSLRDALERNHCTFSETDPFNAEDRSRYGSWIEYTPEDRGPSTLLWKGAWKCAPQDDVAVFGLKTTRAGAAGSVATLDVRGAYYSRAQLDAIRERMTADRTGFISDLFAETGPKSTSTRYQKCSVCGATRKQTDNGPWKLLYGGRDWNTHEHQWTDGVNSATSVTDGRVVLVRRRLALDNPGYVYGAFVLQSEQIHPQEQTDYRWALRVDGGSVFDLANASVTQGSATKQNRIVFGPFVIPWSGQRAGSGFVYYPRFPGSGHASDEWALCITELSSFDGIDAADPKFVYKTSPLD